MASDRSKLTFWLLLAPLLLWLLTLIVLPHVGMFLVSLREKVGAREYQTSFANYAVFFNEPLYWNTFARTAYMSISSTVLTLLIGFPIAYYIAKLARGPAKTTLFLMCLIPFWVSELVRTFGWMILLRETGVFSNLLQYLGLASGPVEMLYNDAAIMVGLVYTSMLFMVVPLVTTLDSLDDSLIEAGYDLGGQQLVDPARNRYPACHARHHFRLHRGIHAKPWELSDPDSARRQGQPVVYWVDL